MFAKFLFVSFSLVVIELTGATNEGHPECACPHKFEPVCSTDMEMFPNKCILDCYSDKTLSEKIKYNFDKKRCACDCPSNWNPVCATDMSSEMNICFLECHGKVQAFDYVFNLGKCEMKMEK